MHDDGIFDEAVAADYDDADDEAFDPAVIARTVDRLTGLAAGGAALEFAIGTGRVALPLAERGVPVAGIELSRAMVARLRAKPGGDAIPVAIGDMAATRVDGTFRLVYLVFNTIMNLTAQAAQVACFRNAAAHLEPGGRFLIEVMVPELQWLPPGETLRVFNRTDEHIGIDEYDMAIQGLVSHHVDIAEGRVRRASVPFRYVWPAEMDLMAELAGLVPVARWGGWDREPFTSESRRCIAVWERPTA
jgi:SAM-dependent methyltransferase